MNIPPLTVTHLEIVAALTIALAFLLFFIIAKLEQWSRLVDLENDFWSKRGIISASFAERCKQIEKGPILKVLLGAGVLSGLAGFIIIVWLWHRSQR